MGYRRVISVSALFQGHGGPYIACSLLCSLGSGAPYNDMPAALDNEIFVISWK